MLAWLQGVEDLIVRGDGTLNGVPAAVDSVLARIGQPNYEVAKNQKIHYDLFEDDDDTIEHLPFFVVREGRREWEKQDPDTMTADGFVEVMYLEASSNRNDHKASKASFVAFTDMVEEFCACRQGRQMHDQPQSVHIPLRRIELSIPATRVSLRMRDEDLPATDYWWIAWRMWMGD